MVALQRPHKLVLIALCGWLGSQCATATSRSGPLQASNSIQTSSQYSECEAFEVHLSLGDDPGSMRVAWRTIGTSCGSSLMYGPLPGQSSNNSTSLQQREVEGSSYTITEGSMCTAPAKKKRFEVTMHVAVLSELLSDTRYWYRIRGTERDWFFQSPVKVGPQPTRPWSFIAFGDMGETAVRKHKSPSAGDTLSAMLSEMKRQPVDLVLHMGDLAYADGRHKAWDSFMISIEPVASKLPYMVGVGNHEYGYQGPSNNDPSGVQQPYRPTWGNFATESGGECGVQAARRFIMPSYQSEDRPPFWYSFDYSNVHFTIISTEHDISPGSTQYRWLAHDLAQVDRCVTPWVVVGLHRPMYVANPHKDNRVVGDHLRSFIEHLLIENKVDLTISGHVHTYYRTCNVRDERCQQDGSGVTHFIVGTAGHSLSDIAAEQQTWMEGDLNEFGFVRFDVTDDVMHARFIGSKTGDVLDEAKLVTEMYTPDECDAMRLSRDARVAALRQQFQDSTATV